MLRVTERDLIQPGQPEMLQKLIIVLNIPLLCAGRHDADHLRENGGSAMVFQNTDSLRSILNIEFSEILIAPDRFAKSIIAQKLLIQMSPGICEFRIGLGKRHEIRGVQQFPLIGSRNAYNLIYGNFQNAQFDFVCNLITVQNFLQNNRMLDCGLLCTTTLCAGSLFIGDNILLLDLFFESHNIHPSCVMIAVFIVFISSN